MSEDEDDKLDIRTETEPSLDEDQRKYLYSTVTNLARAIERVTSALSASEQGYHPDVIRRALLDAKCDVRDASGDLKMVLEELSLEVRKG